MKRDRSAGRGSSGRVERPRVEGQPPRKARSGHRSRLDLALDSTSSASLQAGARQLGVFLGSGQLTEVDAFLQLLGPWAARFNLVASGDLFDVVSRHVLDSMAPAPLLEATGRPLRIADVGSGAGFPGIPLGIALGPDRLVLVEPRRHRASFLRAVSRALPRLRVEVVEQRLLEVAKALPGEFDAVTSRASLPVAELAAGAKGLLRPGGFLVWLGGPTQTSPAGLPGFNPPVVRDYQTSPTGPLMHAYAWRRLG